MNLIAIRELHELLAKFKTALSRKTGENAHCSGYDLVQTFFDSNGGLEAGRSSKLSEDTAEKFAGYAKILKHYVDDMCSLSRQAVAKDHFTISVVLFDRAEDHSITMVQKAIKRARLVLNDAQKDKRHWLWREGLLR